MWQENEQEQGLFSFLHRRGRLMALTFALVFTAGMVTLPLLPKKYLSTAKLIVMRSDQRMGGLKLLNDDVPELTGASHPIYTQVELIQLEPVMKEVVARLDLRDEKGVLLPSASLTNTFQVIPIKGTDLIRVKAIAPDPELARRMLDTLCEVYFDQIQRYRKEGVQAGLKFLEEQLAASRKQLNDSEQRVQAFKHQSGSVSLSLEIDASVRESSEISSAIRTRRLELDGFQARAASLRSKLGMNAREALDAAAIAQNPRLKSIQEQLLAAETSPLRSQGLMSDHPEMRALEQRVSLLKRELESEMKALVGRKVTPRTLSDLQLEALRQLIAAETEVLSTKASLEAAYKNQRSLMSNRALLPEREMRLASLQREVEVASRIYQELLQKRSTAKLGLANNLAYVYVVEPASLPKAPIFPQTKPAVLILILMGLALAYGVSILKDLLCGSLPPKTLASSLFASLPILSWQERRKSGLIAKNGGSPHYLESLKSLGMMLEQRQGEKVFALTSVLEGEGKSFTLANLAWVLAEAGNRVLLVDSDLVRPSLHTLFGIENTDEGLTEVLSGQLSPCDAIKKMGGFDFLNAGRTNQRINLAVLKRGLLPALEVWREAYDFVLIDLPPLQLFAEVAQVAKATDGLLVLANTQKVSWHQVTAAVNQLQSVRVPIIGVISLIQMVVAARGRYYLPSAEGSKE